MLISLAACTDQNGKDDPDSPDFEEGIPTEVRITLSARSGNAQTRAEEEKKPDGTPKDPTSTIELIHDWWIAFVAKNGDVKVITRDEVEEKEKTTSTSVNIGDGFEAETFKTILPSGVYRIYAFANITAMDVTTFKKFLKYEGGKWIHKTINLDSFIEKNRLSNSDTDSMLWHPTYTDIDNKVVDNNIPMSAVMTDIKINNTVENIFNIEVIRAVAKVEFAFHKPSADQITLNTLKFSPISNRPSKISIIPNYDAVGKGPNKKLFVNISGITKGGTGTLTFISNSNFSLTKDASNKYSMGLFNFYCMESIPATESGGPFTIKLDVTRNGENKEYTYQTKDITYINRNDWIFIPITFTDWIIRWRMHYYPPIGGYPPLFEQSNDGTNVTLLATTPGEFEFFSDITKNDGAYNLNEADWKNVIIKKITETKLDGINQLPEGTSLFVKRPEMQAVPGNVADKNRYYIAGEFSNTEGIATVVIEFTLTEGPYANQLKTCTFTITRQNGYQATPSN